MALSDLVLLVRLSSPDGRQVEISLPLRREVRSARAGVTIWLTRHVSMVFRTNRSPTQDAVCVATLERVFEVAWDWAGRRVTDATLSRADRVPRTGLYAAKGWAVAPVLPHGALVELQAAATNVPLDVVTGFLDVLCGPDWRARRPPLRVTDIAEFHRLGQRPEQAPSILASLTHLNRAQIQAAVSFYRRGWTKEQYLVVGGGIGYVPDRRWARFPPELVALARQAGMSARDFAAAHTAGSVTRESLLMLIALSSASDDPNRPDRLLLLAG